MLTQTTTEDVAEPDASNQEPAAVEAAAPTRRRITRRRFVQGVIAAGFIVALGGSGMLGWQAKHHHDVVAGGRAALDAARSYAVTLSSVDTDDIDQNFTAVLNGATGEFKDMYGQASAQLRQLLIDNKARSRGNVIDAAVKSAAKDRVEVLVFLDQSITNAVSPEPRIDRMRMAMTMERVDNHWLASKVDLK